VWDEKAKNKKLPGTITEILHSKALLAIIDKYGFIITEGVLNE